MATVDGKHTAFTLQDHMDFAEKFIAYTGLSKSKTLTINQENIQSLTIAINNTDYYFVEFLLASSLVPAPSSLAFFHDASLVAR